MLIIWLFDVQKYKRFLKIALILIFLVHTPQAPGDRVHDNKKQLFPLTRICYIPKMVQPSRRRSWNIKHIRTDGRTTNDAWLRTNTDNDRSPVNVLFCKVGWTCNVALYTPSGRKYILWRKWARNLHSFFISKYFRFARTSHRDIIIVIPQLIYILKN